jgi:hypothetical protein
VPFAICVSGAGSPSSCGRRGRGCITMSISVTRRSEVDAGSGGGSRRAASTDEAGRRPQRAAGGLACVPEGGPGAWAGSRQSSRHGPLWQSFISVSQFGLVAFAAKVTCGVYGSLYGYLSRSGALLECRRAARTDLTEHELIASSQPRPSPRELKLTWDGMDWDPWNALGSYPQPHS